MSLIIYEMDDGRINAALSLLDLSYAFDTVNHKILLHTNQSLGITGQAYKWFESYLFNRSQIVCTNDCKSDSMPATCGVLQGSVGGPALFSIYLSSLKSILQRHSVKYHCYAD